MKGKVNDSQSDVKYLPTRGETIKPKLLTVTGAAAPAPLVYRGGPVLSGPQFVSFYWGNFSSGEIAAMQQWLAGYAGYLNGAGAPLTQQQVLEQYGTIGATVGPYTTDPTAPSSATDADVHNKVLALQASHALPQFGPERLFLVFTKGITFSGYGTVWCAYHGQWAVGSYYALCPFPASPGCGASNPIPSWQSVTSHEIEEACTDPGLGTGWVAGSEEGGDVCSWQEVSLPFGTVQRFDDNLQSACSVYTVPETAPISAVTWSANRIDVFVRGTDNALWHKWWDGTRWNGYESLGGVFHGNPAAVSWASNRIDVFVRGTDNAVWHRWWDGAHWGGWESLGGIAIGDPVAVSWGPNRLDLFVEGTDGALYHRWWNGTQWGGWESLGGVIVGPPSAVCWGANRIDVFARGLDGAMWHRWWDGAHWGGWESLGGVLVSKPLPVSWGANRLDVFARGTDNALWHKWWDGAHWGGWESLGGTIIGPPSAVCWGANRIDVFARGTDSAMWHKWWDGAHWGGWESLGGVIVGAPVPTTWSANRLDVFAKGSDNALWHKWWDGAHWGGWESLGGVIAAIAPQPAAAAEAPPPPGA